MHEETNKMHFSLRAQNSDLHIHRVDDFCHYRERQLSWTHNAFEIQNHN